MGTVCQSVFGEDLGVEVECMPWVNLTFSEFFLVVVGFIEHNGVIVLYM